MHAMKPRWVAARALVVTGVVSALAVVAAPSASAGAPCNLLCHWQTGQCLDSDWDGCVTCRHASRVPDVVPVDP